jgi:biopolymer transport protein ExbB
MNESTWSLAVDWGVMGLLLALSVVVVAIALERAWFYQRIDLRGMSDARSLELALTRKLFVIGSVASNAPYLGLLGTVFGIMLTFHRMGAQGAVMDTGQIMTGLALALKATAAGLVVALIAVAVYNTLLRRVHVLMLQWEIDRDARKAV